ncbi:hypothetical protein C8Q76DRAFT_648331 [Earliella scabrosa]|nr:hypothetical protein C8Q76DRAFT_648331 [Earliella scabrosa]
MPADIPLVNSELVGLWFELLATGVYYVYFPQCMSILWRKRRSNNLSIWLPGVCLLMFFIVTGVLINRMIRAYHAFGLSGSMGEIPPNPTAFYTNSAAPESLINNSMTVALAIISDVIIVYRTYIVWNSNLWVIVVPIVLLCADIVYGIWATWTLAQTAVGDSPIVMEVTVRARIFFIFTFCINMLCAGLICFRIRRISKTSSLWTSSDRITRRVFEVVTESAALYCGHLLALIVCDAVGSNVFFLLLDPLPPVTALVFSLLIVGTRTGTATMQATSATRSVTDRSWIRTTGGGSSRFASSPAHGVEITLEQVVRTDTDRLPMHTELSSTFGEQSKVPEF